ncbi:MAG TPA: tetratricopeptide repeat protein, partial [Spirochaetia bacterium]|nr:tetratricopeptide repeat protein [Spirochaetia bacterium]
DDFQRVIRDFPASDLRDESAFFIGYIYASRGEHARALPFFQSVARGAAGTDLGDRGQLSVGVCLFNMGNFDRALASLEYLRSARPGGEQEGTVALYIGRTLYRMEKLEDAAERLSAAAAILELPPPGKPASVPGRETEAADARWWLGWSLFRLGRLDDARDAFVSLAQRHPSDPRAAEALYRAGICESTGGDDAAAVELFDQAASLQSQIREQALYEKGWAQQRLGDGAAGLDTFKKLSREFPDGRLAPEAFFKIAMKSYDEGRFVDARAGFQGVAASFPRSVLASQALYWSAESARQAGDFPGAVEAFWMLFAAPPPESLLTASLAGFGMSLETLNSPDSARGFASRARSARGLDPRIAAGVLLASGRVLLSSSPSEALAAAADASRMSPPEPWAGEAALLAGRCSAAMGDSARALDILAALSDGRIDEVGAQATLERARTLEKAGNSRDALEQYLRVPYVFSGSGDLAGEALFNAARLSLQQGDREGSARISGMLRARYPESPWTARLNELGSAR